MRARLAILSIALLGACPAWAVLGQGVASVASDQQRLKGQLRSAAAEGFSVHEITAADGTLVREYVSPAGEVFGVAWRGPAVPDLAELLGDYFPIFQEASRSDARRHRPLVVRTDRLVVEMGGHVRSFRGRAYLPERVPVAVSASVVR